MLLHRAFTHSFIKSKWGSIFYPEIKLKKEDFRMNMNNTGPGGNRVSEMQMYVKLELLIACQSMSLMLRGLRK